jgi:lysophospholipase L1-like esterase
MFFALGLLAMAPAAAPFELKDGDRVVWIGSAIAEREQKYGYWETALLCQWPERKITFRNLGWSGDTVEGIARASFDPPAKGYERLLNAVNAEKPTMIFVSYGSVEALSGMNVQEFRHKLQKLLDDLAVTKAKVCLFTLTPLENDVEVIIPAPKMTAEDVKRRKDMGMPTEPIRTTKNKIIDGFALAIRDCGENQGYRVADLHQLMQKNKKESGLVFTDNGLHLSEAGYEGTIPDFLASLGLSWAGEEPKKFEAVRKAVVKKNQLYFNMWRPQNETYLFGFRKPEQGRNAKEVKEFEPLIAAAEKDIRERLTAPPK